MEIFAEYLDKFMKVFLDDFSIYGSRDEHLQHIKLCLQKCRENGLSLNPGKMHDMGHLGKTTRSRSMQRRPTCEP